MKKQFLLHLVFIAFSFGLAVVLTLPVIGFIFGFTAQSLEEANTAIRIISGLFCAVIVMFEGGRMPHNEGGTAYTNLHHHIIPTFFSLSALFYSTILLFLTFLHYFIRRKKRKS